jgi:small-conductance mechanosensitive channel
MPEQPAIDIDRLILEAEQREQQAREAAAYARGWLDALRAIREAARPLPPPAEESAP